MIKRLYIHNFRCLENFELPVSGLPSALLIGKNGSGKTAVGLALRILQRIGRRENRVGRLVHHRDFSRRRTDVPLRLEIEVELNGATYGYDIAFEVMEGIKKVGVLEEKFMVNGKSLFARVEGGVRLARHGKEINAHVRIDRQLVALPILQQESADDPLFIFREWLARMLILRPTPILIGGNSENVTLEPHPGVTNLGAWFAGLLAQAPSAYSKIDEYLRQVMPDLKDIKNPLVGEARSMFVQFSNDQGSIDLPFVNLSDGEKCFVICALVLAANDAYGTLLCYWDEPDNYLAPSEVGHFVLALRKAFQSGGQFIATSHNSEAIQRFSNENTFVLYRKSHLEPTIIRPLEELKVSGDLVDALIRGDVEP